jgi:hypothetical protein
MTRSNNIFKLVCFIAVMMLSLVGCERRPLEDPSEYVEIKVKVNIKTVANVTVDVYNKNIPLPDLNTDMMRVLVYDPVTKKLLTQSFISGKSYDEDGSPVLTGTLNIAYGNYDILVYNWDTPETKVTSESDEDAIYAYTEGIPAAQKALYAGRTKADDGTYDLTKLDMRYEPDHLLVAREHNVRISPHDKLLVISTEARTVIDSYYIQIHVEGLQYASSAMAVVSGLSPSNHIGLDERDQDPAVAVAFDMIKSTDPNLTGENKDVICAIFNTFGKIPEANSDLIVTFNVIDVSGNLQQFQTNLNEVFRSENAIQHHWLLLDETWVIDNPLPDVNPTNGGFQPSVDDWEEEYGEIIL